MNQGVGSSTRRASELKQGSRECGVPVFMSRLSTTNQSLQMLRVAGALDGNL